MIKRLLCFCYVQLFFLLSSVLPMRVCFVPISFWYIPGSKSSLLWLFSRENHLTERVLTLLVAELQRAKCASEAPWVRKIGNPSSRENLVMTSAYARASERTSVQTRGEGEGRLEISLTVPIWETLSLAVFCLEKSEKHSFLFAMSTNDRSGWSNVSR